MDINANRINVNEPRYDQNTYAGRAKHFFITTDPRNLLASSVQLENAKQTVTDYRLVQLKILGLIWLIWLIVNDV